MKPEDRDRFSKLLNESNAAFNSFIESALGVKGLSKMNSLEKNMMSAQDGKNTNEKFVVRLAREILTSFDNPK